MARRRGSWPTRRKIDSMGRPVRDFATDGNKEVTIRVTGGRNPYLSISYNGKPMSLMWDRRRLRAMAESILRMLDDEDGEP